MDNTEEKILDFHNQRGTTNLSLIVRTGGVVLSCAYTFASESTEADTEADTYESIPFSHLGVSKAIERLVRFGECELLEDQQFLRINKESSGTFGFSFQIKGHDACEIRGLPFDPGEALRILYCSLGNKTS